MGRVSPDIRRFSEKLVDYEVAHSALTLSRLEGALQVCEKLRQHLTGLIGPTGYHALISRSLVLLKKDSGWTEPLAVTKNGTIGRLPSSEETMPSSEMQRDPAGLPAQLLALLAILIGKALTLKLACEVWPQVASEKELPDLQSQ